MFLYNIPKHTERRKELRQRSTDTEQSLWRVMKGKQLGVKVRRQFGIGYYIVDFYIPSLKLAIEIDGESHFTEAGMAYDQERDDFISGLFITTIRFTNDEVRNNLDGVLETILDTIKTKTPSSSPLAKGERREESPPLLD